MENSLSDWNGSLQTNQVMGSEPIDRVIHCVEEKLHRLRSSPSQFSISRVPDVLRKLNEKAYEPKMLAIGPYHCNKNHLLAFEEYKISYLQTLIDRTGIPCSDYVSAMWALEERARNCYGGSISLDKDEFVQMMLFDGCFIVEVIRKFRFPYLRGDDDLIFKQRWMLPYIIRDMILLENQLPFFVLWNLFIMTKMANYPTNESFLFTILYFFYGILPGKGCPRDDVYRVNDYPINEIKHLVHLIHDNWLPSPAGMEAYELHNCTNDSDWSLICSATEMQEAGVKFQKVHNYSSLFDIEFENGVMKIPIFDIVSTTEDIFQNFIAYELCSHDINLKHVLHYVTFLYCLVNSSKDAELLRRLGIIGNWLGFDEVIATSTNRLFEGALLGKQFYYREAFNKVNLHCSRRRYKWLAKLWHIYFDSPWSFISFVAAVCLLVLTFLQTLYSILSYKK